MTFDVVGGQRLFVPSKVKGLVEARATNRGVNGEGLVGVDHDLEIGADGVTNGGEASDVLVSRSPHLDLAPAETRGLGAKRIVDELRRLNVQPAALGRVKRDRSLSPAGFDVERPAALQATQVPKRRVDGAERERGDRAD